MLEMGDEKASHTNGGFLLTLLSKKIKGCYRFPPSTHFYHPSISHAPLSHRDMKRGPRTNKAVIQAPQVSDSPEHFKMPTVI